ncbi:MAG: Do family serine endopeptidase [Proteobacteria bacterium]|nr:Do family serine endopeptidase [Pseudomonadota bacterium]
MTSEHEPRKPEFLRNRLLAAGSAAAIIIFGLGAFGLWAHPGSDVAKPKAVTERVIQVAAQEPVRMQQPPRMVEMGSPFSFADLVERVSPAVVTVTVEERVQQEQLQDQEQDGIPDPFRDFFNRFGRGNRQFAQPQQPRKALATGSGFIIDKAGFIVTNNHVIENATKITVKLPDGREFSAKLIGADAATDVALIKIESNKALPTVEFGDDKKVRVGDWVIAVGNPFGLSNTVTAGIVSSLGRNVGAGAYNDFIQIDAPINRGNSGGPTFDIEGHVIGMNSMIFSPTGGSVGIGFAIPASTIHDVVAQLKAHGKVARGWLGVEIQSVTPEIAASLGEKEMKGAIVATVVPGSPAAQAGFEPGDLVVALNGSGVDDSRSLTRRVAALQAGTTATFSIVRNGDQKTLTAKIGQRKDDQVASNVPGNSRQDGQANTGSAMGLGLAAVTPDVRRAYNLDDNVSGVLITRVDPDSDAADKGLQPGDVVVSIGNRVVHSPQEIKQRIAQAQAAGRTSVLMLVVGEGGQRFVAVKIARG